MNQGLHNFTPNYGLKLIAVSRTTSQDYGIFIVIFAPISLFRHVIASFNMTYEDFIETHINSGADMTVLYNEDGYRCDGPSHSSY